MKKISLLTLALGTFVAANSFAADVKTTDKVPADNRSVQKFKVPSLALIDNRSATDLAQVSNEPVPSADLKAFAIKKALIDQQGGEVLSDFKPIFNGKNLSGWDGSKDFWSAKDG